ncbi:hypothetical protein [Pseudomonas veronii]|nr:hypothetical protein [Pseudomonas veronii]
MDHLPVLELEGLKKSALCALAEGVEQGLCQLALAQQGWGFA